MIRFVAAVALLVPPAFAAAPQDPAPEPREVEHLDAWPELDKGVEAQVKTDVQRLIKARTPEMSSQAHDGLVAAGAGAAPRLLTALGKERDEAARDRITKVLVELTDAPHTRLLAQHFDAKSDPLRRFALRRAALFPDEGTRAAAEAAWRAVSDPKKRKRVEAEDLFAGALAATASGLLEPVEVLYEVALDDWKDEGEAIHRAATAVRSEAACLLFVPKLDAKERKERIAALRLLAACGTEEHAARSCAKHLDASDNGVRIAAINALRGILDGDPPLERLSAFDAIELAKQWKQRVR